MPDVYSTDTFRFKIRSRVRMSQTDIVGIVNNIRYFEFMELGRFEYFRDIGFHYGDLSSYRVAMTILESSCRYLSPLYFDENIDIYVRVDYLGRSSFHVKYLVEVPERKVIVAEGRTVSVFIDPESRKPIEIPEDLRRLIIDYEGKENISFKENKAPSSA